MCKEFLQNGAAENSQQVFSPFLWLRTGCGSASWSWHFSPRAAVHVPPGCSVPGLSLGRAAPKSTHVTSPASPRASSWFPSRGRGRHDQNQLFHHVILEMTPHHLHHAVFRSQPIGSAHPHGRGLQGAENRFRNHWTPNRPQNQIRWQRAR